ncbi:hypothetical protein DL546_002390 [Coniochaeta pulveracea]|uniref:ubiquitinyl hydrolase 1 n=1 Tax=Coniochaeta pulveracea TaxID=177199 RepID=A0A420Y690_9PEZI|nr:hypothetical protein DL546_002390 [Coniochaeta pulveracea]
MNSDEKRLQRQFLSSYDNPNIYHNYYTQLRFRDRLTQPALLLSLGLLAVFAYYQFASQNPHLLPRLSVLLWDSLVRIIPARLIFALDGWLNPPLFPKPMLTQQRTNYTYADKSDALQRILRVDKAGGIVASVSQAGRRSLSGLSSVSLPSMSLGKGDVERPAGLVNRGVVCFQNSIVQGLASLRHYSAYLDSLRTEDAAVNPQRVIALRKLIHDLNDPANNGRTFKTERVLEQESMSTWQQQDAQEYFSKLLDEVDKEIGKLAQTAHKPTGFEAELCSTKDDTTASQHSDDSGYQSASGQLKGSSTDWKSLRNPLEGRHAQRVACLTCGYSEGLTMIPFNCLTLNLGTDRKETDLYRLLDGYTSLEQIPGVECPKCTLLKYQETLATLIEHLRAQDKPEETLDIWYGKLEAVKEVLEDQTIDDETIKRLNITKKCSSTKTKQIVLARPPQSLVVHVNRSVFNETTGEIVKNRAAVRFPNDLDLGPWCLGSKLDPEDAEDKEDWLSDPRSSMVAGSQGRPRIEGPIYELRGVVTHHGAHNNGHYICYRKHGRVKRDLHLQQEEKPEGTSAGDLVADDDTITTTDVKQSVQQDGPETESQWWELSDDDVTKVDEKFVFNLPDVFMLFYDCVDPRQVPLAAAEEYEDSVSLQAPKQPQSPRPTVEGNSPVFEPLSETDEDI